MKAEDLLYKCLEVSPPWQIVRIRDDLGKSQIDVWIGQQTGKGNWLFGAKTASVSEAREQAWRHLNLGDTRCVVHAEAGADTAALPWQGEKDQPFTHAMSGRIVAMMRAGITLQSVCAILDITVGDLWKFKYGLDSGKTGLSASLSMPSAENAATGSRVPDADSAVWSGLLDGSTHLDIRLLSLKFLLTKMREQMRVITDHEVRALKCYELQRFFVRYEKTLGHELSQLDKLA
jgi:hypothetical protein